MRTIMLSLMATTALTTVSFAQTAQNQSAADAPPAAEATKPTIAAPTTAPSMAAPAVKPAAKPIDYGTVSAPQPIKPKPPVQVAKPEPEIQPAAPKKKIVDKSEPTKPKVTSGGGGAATSKAVDTGAATGVANGLPLSDPNAIGSNAPKGSAPALSVSQQSLDSFQPGSVVSDKVLRDVVQPSSDYNEAAKFTPGFYSNNANGPLGDSKSGWRGFKDGQFNITFDGIPFGDVNNPSHHSAAYFPGSFIGGVVIDRGPGAASQAGYATFGGTMSLQSRELKDNRSTEIEGSYGNYGTYTGAVTQQTGLIGGTTRAMAQYSYAKTDGAIDYGHVDTNNFLLKLDTKLDDNWKLTLFGTTGYEAYNQTNALTFNQLQTYGRKYGTLNMDPKTQGFVPFNTTEKRTDMVYANLEGKIGYGITLSNKAYTYAYDYPSLQNNAQTTGTIGASSLANGGTVNSFTITNPVGTCLTKGVSTGKTCTTTVNFSGIPDGDVTGYKQVNNYRAFGNLFDAKKDIDAGYLSGQLRGGLWIEKTDNHRWQKYYNNTQGKYYDQFGTTVSGATAASGTLTAAQEAINRNAAGYKLDLNSHLTNVQVFGEYEWKPLAGLSITPGYKYESITRDHDANVNQTSLQPANFSRTYEASLPFLSVRQKLSSEWTVYGQASKGFLIPSVAAFYVLDFAANQDKPETTTNYQTGVVYKSEKMTFGIDAYKIMSVNAANAITDPLTKVTSFGGNQNVTRQGLEAQGTYAFGNGLALFGSFAIMEATITASSSQPLNVGQSYANTPSYTLAFGPIFDNGKYFGSVLHKTVGDQYGSSNQFMSTATADGELNHIGAYSSTDVVAGMRFDTKSLGFGQSAEVKLGVNNVFDNHNIVDISGQPKQLSASKDSLTYTSQAGRIIYLGGKVTF
jgi:iron complex outermembrane recepter protein